MMRWHVLEKLIKSRGWKTGAELGVWQGRTYMHLIKTCPGLSLIGVDLYQPQPNNEGPETWVSGENGHEWNHEKYYNDIIKFIKKRKCGTFYRMRTDDAAQYVKNDSIDFVFIDADHSYESVKTDIKNWSPKVKTGGSIIGHDIDWEGVQKAVIEEFGSYITLEDNVWMVNK